MMRDNLKESRITPPADSAEIRTCFDGTLGRQGRGLLGALEDFERLVLPRSLAISNPMYMGLVNSSPLPGAALMDCLVSALDNNAGASHQGPSSEACEAEAIRSLTQALGLGRQMTGLFLPGGTYANLHGLLLARRAAFRKWGASHDRLTIYHSETCHFSIARAALVIGLDPANLRPVPVRGRGSMDTGELDRLITRDKAAGLVPCAVACNLGSTGTGALDPIGEVVEVCRHHDLWCHVDACIGGPLLLLEEYVDLRPALAGVDSLAVDLHKWFFMPLTASLILTRHPGLESDCFQLEASYIPEGEPEAFQRGIPTSRRATGLTVWLALRAYGWDFIAQTVRNNIRLTRLLEDRLRERGYRVLPGGKLSVCCARMEHENLPPDFHEKVAESIRKQGTAWFATVRHGGLTWWRLNILNLYVNESHVLRMAELLDSEVRSRTPAGKNTASTRVLMRTPG
jgi:glutamate/tyrosine decarboxylase-like PLP-dependent enzyme